VANEYETKPISVTRPPRRMKGFLPILSTATPTGRREKVAPKPPNVCAWPTKDMLTPSATMSGATDGELNPTAKPKSASAAMRMTICRSGSERPCSFLESVAAHLAPQISPSRSEWRYYDSFSSWRVLCHLVVICGARSTSRGALDAYILM